MGEISPEHIAALSAYLKSRRPAILEAWRAAADADPAQTTVSFLSRAQFDDHIPQLLDAFERKLTARPGGNRAAAADLDKTAEEVKHGLQRWQQGYRLTELMHEWGHLHICLFEEVQSFAGARPQMDRGTLATIHRELISLINEGINESAGQYARMQQAEAAAHVRDLQRALTQVNELERRRSELIRQAVHDLRGNVQSVSTAAEVLRVPEIADEERLQFTTLVQQGIEAVGAMVSELMELARLEAGQEIREVASLDAGKLLLELCTSTRPIADLRKLFLKMDGPAALIVEGDANKIRRLVQNLLFNALKYTEQGGVTVSWGEEKKSWWVVVKDTGPGFLAEPDGPIAEGLGAPIKGGGESAEFAAGGADGKPVPLPAGGAGATPTRRIGHSSGEGIGLSIVKRLCELLDASIELANTHESGTTFRVVFPRSYQLPPAPPKIGEPRAL